MQTVSASFVPVVTDSLIEETAHLANIIWHDCFAKLLKPEQIDYMVEKFQSAPAMKDQIHNQGYEYFQVCRGEEPVGYTGIQAKDNKLLLSKLYLLREVRGLGFGKQTLDFVQQAGRERECTAVWLTVNRYNERAIAVYRKTGFDLSREQVVDIGGGFVMDDFVFEKPL